MSTWCDEYRDIIDFYFWEPQHLGRKKDPDTPYQTFALCWEHVARMEVALNHLLNIYFALVPLKLLNNEADWVEPDSYRFLGTVELEDLGRRYGGFTQPDLLFRGTVTDCAIELKVKGRVTLDQIQKYVLLQALSAPSQPLNLIVVTPHSGFRRALQKNLESSDAVSTALLAMDIPHWPTHQVDPMSYTAQVAALTVIAISYEDLATAIRARLSREPEGCVIARNAHQGILGWLHDCGLTLAA